MRDTGDQMLLAVLNGPRITVLLRDEMEDRPYRTQSILNPATGAFDDVTAFRARSPDQISEAVDRLHALRAEGDIRLAKPASAHANDIDTTLTLCLYADFLRHVAERAAAVHQMLEAMTPPWTDARLLREVFEPALDLDRPDWVEAFLDQHREGILAVAKEPEEMTGNVPYVLRLMAELEERRGALAQAVDALSLSCKLDTNSGKLERLIRLHDRLGQKEDAKRHLTTYAASYKLSDQLREIQARLG